jgi:ferredoxin--NADP+ reductase
VQGRMTDAEIAELRRRFYNATVVRRIKPHDELLILRVRPDFPIPAHKPGQYATLGLGCWEPRCEGCEPESIADKDISRIVKRAYSISSSILDDTGALLERANADWLEFYVVLVRDSSRDRPPAFTPRLFRLTEGDRLFLGEKIVGRFTLDPVKPEDTVVFLSTGTGEAPHNYMLWQLLRRGHRGLIVAVCCVRYQRDLGYLAVHEELMRRYHNYTYVPLTTREPETVNRKVHIQDLITSGALEERLGGRLDPATTHVFLCGNPGMIGVPNRDPANGAPVYPQPPGVVELLQHRGFQADRPQGKMVGNIHFEEYW